MDGSRFDDLARGLVAARSRRGLLGAAAGLLGAAALGAADAPAAQAEAEAACRGFLRPCSLAKAGGCVRKCKRRKGPAKRECLAHCQPGCAKECCSGFWEEATDGRGKRVGLCSCRAEGQSCGLHAHCCSGACDGGVCVATDGTCPAGAAHTCADFRACGRDSRGACSCTRSVEGATACGSDGCFENPNPCASTAQCEGLYGAGYVCQAAGSGCCGRRCVVPCGAVVGQGAGRAVGAPALVRNRGA